MTLATTEKIGRYRWTICGLLFFATTINYIDRSVISFLKSTFTETLGWTDADYTDVEITFKVFYAIGLISVGGIIDRMGTKIGYATATFLWSVAGVATALASTVFGFKVVRGALGLAEAGNFPAAIKTVAEWHPKKERALATGIFNSGANIGAIITPITVPFIVVHWGWQWAFILTGMLGFVWLIFWFILYDVPRRSKRLSAAELAYIESDLDEEKIVDGVQPRITWKKVLGYKATWAFSVGKFLTDPIWWFYIFWLPDYFKSIFPGMSLMDISFPVAIVYIISTVGSVYGGFLPMYFVSKKGWTIPKSRRIAMLIYACFVVPILSALVLGHINMWFGVIVIGIAAAAHQAWSANIYTTVSDVFPKAATGSVTGIGGMFGAIGGIALSLFVQRNMFVHYRSIGKIETAYYIMFTVCALAYLTAWFIMRILLKNAKPITTEELT